MNELCVNSRLDAAEVNHGEKQCCSVQPFFHCFTSCLRSCCGSILPGRFRTPCRSLSRSIRWTHWPSFTLYIHISLTLGLLLASYITHNALWHAADAGAVELSSLALILDLNGTMWQRFSAFSCPALYLCTCVHSAHSLSVHHHHPHLTDDHVAELHSGSSLFTLLTLRKESFCFRANQQNDMWLLTWLVVVMLV